MNNTYPLGFKQELIDLKRLSGNDGEPHIVFIGTPNIRESWNNVESQIQEITKRKIHVHIAKTPYIQKRNSFLHFFSKFEEIDLITGSFADFLTQFDAGLVLYNFNKNAKIEKDRFNNVIPNRFLFNLTAGIPIFLPKGQLPSCEKIIEESRIGLIYANLDELEQKLKCFDFMQNLRKNVVSKCFDFTYENNFSKIDNFIRKISNLNSKFREVA